MTGCPRLTDVLKYIETDTGKVFYALEDAEGTSWKICQLADGPKSFQVMASVRTREEARQFLEALGLKVFREEGHRSK